MFISRGKYRWKFLEKFERIRVNERSSMIIDDSEGWLALRIFPPVIKKKKLTSSSRVPKFIFRGIRHRRVSSRTNFEDLLQYFVTS